MNNSIKANTGAGSMDIPIQANTGAGGMDVSMRSQIDYTLIQQNIMDNQKKITLLEMENKKLKGEAIIYDNQEQCSLRIVSSLHNKKIISILIIALTQSGKTGTMSALIKNYLKDPTTLIPIDNIFIITGLSSIEWINQTTVRMPKSLQSQVFHRSDLNSKFVNRIKNRKNILIIIDEIQIAAKENQSIHKAFQVAGLYNKQKLLKNDIKIIEFTATPDGNIYDLMNWGENALKIKMNPGKGYTSCFDLYNKGRVLQYKDLCCYDKSSDTIDKRQAISNIKKIKNIIEAYDLPLYHIIRTPNGYMSDIVINNFKNIFGRNIQFKKYDKNSDFTDINKILNIRPYKHTYIFVKEKLRCAKTLNKKYLGVVYERFTKRPDDTVIIQGLIGRGTGYDDNCKSVYFTNKRSILKYEKLWKSNFEDKTINWRSKTTAFKNNIIRSKGTYNNPKLIDGMSVSSTEDCLGECEPVIKKFTQFDSAKRYVKETLGNKRGPNNPKKKENEYGFLESTVRGIKKVWSTSEMYKERKCNIKNGARYGLRCCYEDIHDKNSLQYWVIHY